MSSDYGVRLGEKDGLAVALSATATDDVINEVICLTKDKSNGDSRLLLLPALRRSKTLTAKEAIKELSIDPLFQKEIASWKKKGQ